MITLTWPGGQTIEIDGRSVKRIRRTHPDIDGPNGRSRVDWYQTDLFEEDVADIASMVLQELPTLVVLTLPNGWPVWFDATKATGPIYVVPTNRVDGVGSAVKIDGMTQYIRETPEEVQTLLATIPGSTVLPIRRDLP